MAAESEAEASFLERLIGSRNRDLSIFFPFILGVMGPPRREAQGAQGPDQETHDAQGSDQEAQERIVLINPFTQGMIIIDGGGRSLDALVREISEMETGKKGPPPASKASIESMPKVEISKEGEECAICLEGMEVGGEAKEMPCKHRYHWNCIEKWLRLHGSCPVCRYKMPVEEEEEPKKGDEGNGRREGRVDREIWVSFSLGRRDSSTSPTPAVDRSDGE
ncbi:E3 ubiquitin-protein ligase MPSR1-like [Magnolia sinica]|uniref:E3 ubiquitin-protein ligase MPSR1-like n=1 Tax=Magnolia sinica TaxID=86752 RepID=UPI0026597E3A|nr:E3 ubiquitin-protein ligase MPSR1-like [Magnolia sinica]